MRVYARKLSKAAGATALLYALLGAPGKKTHGECPGNFQTGASTCEDFIWFPVHHGIPAKESSDAISAKNWRLQEKLLPNGCW